MSEIKIYGASDDLIEVEGAISEEFGCYGIDEESKRYLACSDGTLLSVYYDNDGIWRFNRLIAGTATYSKVDGVDDRTHSDVVTLGGDIKWIAFAEGYAK